MKQQTSKDLKKAVRLLEEFAEDAVVGKLFELPCGRLFFDPDGDIWSNEAIDVSDAIVPQVRKKEDYLQQLIKRAIEAWGKELPLEIDVAVTDVSADRANAAFIMGMFLGARMADPSKQAISNLGHAWIRAATRAAAAGRTK